MKNPARKLAEFEEWILTEFRTQGVFAEKLGVGQNTVSQWIAGKNRVRPEFQVKIRALGYSGPFGNAGEGISADQVEQAAILVAEALVGYRLPPPAMGRSIRLVAEELAEGRSVEYCRDRLRAQMELAKSLRPDLESGTDATAGQAHSTDS